MTTEFVLLLQEVRYHPNSYLKKLSDRFESTSIVIVTRKDELKRYNKPPLFDEKYLVLFDDLALFRDNKAFLSFPVMFPVIHVEHRGQLDDARFLCREFDIPYQVYNNEFTREQALEFIVAQASQPVSDRLCKTILRQVGLNPFRIMTAIGVCEQMGYSESNVEKYVDKWVYPDVRKLIECLLGVPSSKQAVASSMQYLYLNRYWYRFVQKILLEELDAILEVYKDKIEGILADSVLLSYIDEHKVTRARVMYSLSLFSKVSIASVFALREFIKNASLMDLVLRLS